MLCWKSLIPVAVVQHADAKPHNTPQKPQILQNLSVQMCYLVQVRCEVLVERTDQHVKSPLTLLGKRWRLQCGFFSIDY